MFFILSCKLTWKQSAQVALCVVTACVLLGCRGERIQSSLHAEGPAARSVAQLWWVLFSVLGIYTLAVFGLVAVGILFRDEMSSTSKATTPKQKSSPGWIDRSFLGSNFFGSTRLVVLGGIILPALILVPLLVYSSVATASLRMRDSGLVIQVIGHRWWWEVKYPEQQLESANQLVIPVGEPVRIELTSGDVIHSFWVPQLHGKSDMLPGRTTHSWLLAERPGVYRGQCAEYCGTQHALMAFEVIALPQEQFVDWVNAGGQPLERAEAPPTQRSAGEVAFFRHGCSACHAIAGTAAVGQVGPDLSDLADRRMLAAATLPNTRDNLLAWLRDPQAIKPGAKMPPTEATDEELESIVEFLESLSRKGASSESAQ